MSSTYSRVVVRPYIAAYPSRTGLAEWFLALLSAISLLAGHLLRAFVRLGRMPAWIFLFIKFELLKS